MKKRVLCCLFVIVVPVLTALAADSERGWELTPLISMHWGSADEFFLFGTPDRNKYISRLNWDIESILMIGVTVDWDSGKWGGFSFNATSGWPKLPSGKMDDRDWVYKNLEWSHWSQSDITLQWAFIADAAYGIGVVEKGPFRLHVGAGYHLDAWSWTDTIKDSLYSGLNDETITRINDAIENARSLTPEQREQIKDGNYQSIYESNEIPEEIKTIVRSRLDTSDPASNPPWEFVEDQDGFRNRPNKLPTGINGVDFSLLYQVPHVSLEFSLTFPTVFMKGGGRIGPVIAYAHDHHKLREIHFYLSGFGGPWFDVFLEVGISFEFGSFSLRGHYAQLVETYGVIIAEENGRVKMAKNKSSFVFQRYGCELRFTTALPSS